MFFLKPKDSPDDKRPASGHTLGTRIKELTDISFSVFMEQIFIILMGVVNNMMVSSVGDYALSAVGVIDTISVLLIAFFAALTTGATIVVAQYTGKGERAHAEEAAAQSVLLAVIFSLTILLGFILFKGPLMDGVFSSAEMDVKLAGIKYFNIVNFSFPLLALTQTIFGILRGSGDTRSPMVITFFMNIANILLGLVLIMGIRMDLGLLHLRIPSFGVQGAAVALTLSRSLGLVIALVYILKKSLSIRLRFNLLKPNLSLQKILLGIGLPTSAEQGLFQLGKFITLLFIMPMGTKAMSANFVASSLFNLLVVPGTAVGMGSMVLIGQRIGRGETDDVKPCANFSILAGMTVMAAVCFVSFWFTDPLISLYNQNADSIVHIRQLLYSSFITIPLLWPVSFITPYALRAAGDVKYTMIIAILSMWSLRIVLGYIFGVMFGWGVLGVWCGMYCDWVLRGVMFYVRLMGDRWRNKSIADLENAEAKA